MAGRSDRVQILASQLAANDFPPICAMTGRPAETWRKFRFVTPPAWVHLLLLAVGTEFCLYGIIAYTVVVNLVGPSASGYLPLTRSSATRLNVYLWTTIASVPFSIVLIASGLVVGNTHDSTRSVWGISILIAGAVSAPISLVVVVVRPYLGPGAKVTEVPGQTERLVELKRVHPAFAAAVMRTNVAKAAQSPGPN